MEYWIALAILMVYLVFIIVLLEPGSDEQYIGHKRVAEGSSSVRPPASSDAASRPAPRPAPPHGPSSTPVAEPRRPTPTHDQFSPVPGLDPVTGTLVLMDQLDGGPSAPAHHAPVHHDPTPTHHHTHDPSPSYSPPDPNPSYDSGGSSYDTGSSGSFDSGGGGGGGGFD